MVRFDVTRFRYLNRDDFRVLTAIEMGMKNHEIVPTSLILRIAALKKTNGHLVISTLAKYGLVHHENKQYDGYKLTYMGYDFLAIRAFVAKGLIKAVGQQIGVGKESDVYEVLGANDEIMIMKIHRLGRVCFRSVRKNRDYLGKRKSASFLYMSRLAAVREFAYLKALYDEGFPTPVPYEVNRHCILMSRINAKPLHTFTRLKNPTKVYNTLMNMLVKFAQCGLIHCDFNEFNLLLNSNEEITVIDFPQMISTNHPNAKEFFDRDACGIRRFFNRKLGYEFDDVPEFQIDTSRIKELDLALKASGHTKMFIAEFSRDGDQEREDYERIMADAREILRGDFENGVTYDEDDEDDEDDDTGAEYNDHYKNLLLDDNYGDESDGDYEDEDTEMIFYDEDAPIPLLQDNEDDDDDRLFMRARHAKNADKYNPVSKYLQRGDDVEQILPGESNDPQQQFLTAQQLSGLNVIDDSDATGALYTKTYNAESSDGSDGEGSSNVYKNASKYLCDSDEDDENEDEDDEYDEDDEDDENDEDKHGYRVGNLWFATRGEKKAYVKRQKDLQHIIALRQKRESLAPSKDQIKNTVKRASEKQREKEKNKNRKIAKGGDQRTKKHQREIKQAIKDAMKR